ncbi:helix-turn-helix transcriptional regulator [Kutzneria sp. CA-103260]|uniref:helix-turn-helix transcriptional regulator n=1 Tax=Kutzneria sp. CA-103260 TaxID=2802641 RepID=UPI001BAA884E|nr:LuxR C-terminal-related transcriptional regulator [Kutzneria sp. CA-103260]QUQ65421.1 HTH-type transcriptional regulator MalT [Kutzneria sp. CA-103260]
MGLLATVFWGRTVGDYEISHEDTMGRQFRLFSPDVASVIRDTDRKMSHFAKRNRFELYNSIRVELNKVWRVDSFCIGLRRADNAVFYPYNFDDGRNFPPNFNVYGRNGLAAWLQRNGRPYWFKYDQGALLANGHRFGNFDKSARDAVVAPMLADNDGHRRVLGSIGMYSYQPDTYDSETVSALGYIAAALTLILFHERVESSTGELDASDLPTYSTLIIELIDRFGGDLERAIQSVDRAIAGIETDMAHVRGELSGFRSACRNLQVEVMEALASPNTEPARLMNLLTPRERVVANLIAHGFANKQVAERLHISELTAKTHTSRILKKFKAKQRSEIATKISSMVQFGGSFEMIEQP